MRFYLKQMKSFVECIQSIHLRELTLKLEKPHPKHCDDLSVLEFFKELPRFPFLRVLEVVSAHTEPDIGKQDLIIDLICQLTRLEKLRFNTFYAVNLDDRINFQNLLVTKCLNLLPNLRVISIDEPYDRKDIS